jgi:uncharacterized repeat protein (TIGR03803 family)
MSLSRVFVVLLATLSFLGASLGAHAGIGILPIQDQDIPSGKTLVVPIPASDPGGPARSYTVTISAPTVTTGSTTVSATNAGITAVIRTGDPHFTLGVSYTDSNSIIRTGTMEFQLLRELTPVTTQIIAGLAEGGFYSPRTSGTGTRYITFHRVVPGFVIQGGDPNGDGTGGPGFTFPDEFNSALIFSGTAGQLAMANSGHGVNSGGSSSETAYKALHSFAALAGGTNADGAEPSATLVAGTGGVFYGTAKVGGTAGAGTVFQVATSGTAGATVAALHSFTGGNDGGNPAAGLVTGTDGNLYGATVAGGVNGEGTIFQLTTSGSLATL